jgi:small-conductance mechanosensitive channel
LQSQRTEIGSSPNRSGGPGTALRALVLALAGSLCAWAGQPPTPPPAAALPSLQLDGEATLKHLNQVVNWYRRATTGINPPGLPSDALYQDQVQALAAQAVRLAFQSARAEVALIAAEERSQPAAPGSGSTHRQNLVQAEASASAQIEQIQAQAAALQAQAAKAPASRRAPLQDRLEALQGRLDLQKARLDAIQKMASFVESSGEGGDLGGAVEQLARSIPEVLGAAAGANPAAAGPRPAVAASGGLISQTVILYDCMSAERQLQELEQATQRLREVADKVRVPLRDALRATLQQGQAMGDGPASAGPAGPGTERAASRELTRRFKQLSGTLLPLSQELITLDDERTSWVQWRAAVERGSRFHLRAVLIRVTVIVLALVLVLALSELWRRFTFRYTSDPRRRRQFQVLRRVVTGFLVTLVLTLGLVTQFSSLATFAGFITAGVAVGLQAVLLSVAAYFLLIGRYGIRVGDRITLAGITGDVVDIGLVRLYLMELTGNGLDFRPTGRVVVFSNSVLFQAGTPLFKQIPGTEYTWHEVAVTVSPGGDYRAAQQKLAAGVERVYAGYRDALNQQHADLERRADILVDTPRPEALIHFADAGLELLVRYPVELRRAREVDEQVTREVLDLVDSDPALKAALVGTPKIRSAVKG